jgi:Ricin-type beta-trefoil lectin domain-like
MRLAPVQVAARLLPISNSDEHRLVVRPTGVDSYRVGSDPSGRVQIVGASHTAGRVIEVRFEQYEGCSVRPVSATLAANGEPEVRIDSSLSYRIEPPWAFDASGRALETWFEVSEGNLLQKVDATSAAAPVFFDPTYTPLTCAAGYYASLSASEYLDMWGPGNDVGECAPAGLFNARNNYLPVFASEANVANDYGKVAVKQGGGCSFPAVGTGPVWDFDLPCKAHDYCYDLRKAGFSGTVTDSDCDGAFYWLMEAHCNNRVLANDCRLIRNTYYNGVTLPGVVTDPDPAGVSIKAVHSGKCADVSGAGLGSAVPIIQYDCVGGAPEQKYKFWPAPNAPGLFQLRPTHSGACADVNISTYAMTQFSCGVFYTEQRFQVVGSFSVNIFTLRSQRNSFTRCWTVPGNSFANLVQLKENSCAETNNQRWILA